MGGYIKGMEMPKNCLNCAYTDSEYDECVLDPEKRCPEDYGQRAEWCPLIPVPPHGDLIDRDALIEDLKRQCKEVFRIDAVSPDDYWIIRDTAYNQRLWQSWCEGFYEYLGSRPTIIPADKEENDGEC